MRERAHYRSASCPGVRGSISRRSATTRGSASCRRRTYGSKETRTLAFIRRARELGFSLEEIRALLNLGAPASASCAEVREIAARHLRDIREKIADLNKLDALLSKTIRRCSGKAVPECPIIDVLDVRPPTKQA